MNFHPRCSSRSATLLWVAALGAFAPLLTVPAHAAPKTKKVAPPRLISAWPARRVLLVLPVTPSATWAGTPELGSAIGPLVQPELQEALSATGKFSPTIPHRFNPLLRRGLEEKRLAETDITPFVAAPTLETARAIVDKLAFEQPLMIADVRLEELVTGGTPNAPTVLLRVSGRLYEQGKPEPVESIEVISRPSGGKTPEARISAAAEQAFRELANGFVMSPVIPEFSALMPAPGKLVRAGVRPATPTLPGAMPGTPTMPSTPPTIATPNRIAPTPGTPTVPQLPPPVPPLGVAAGGEATVAP
ncbi:MAG: hypothetical protein KY445_03600 [Armatimonadetes bacterium]|nr:hypothetical protein [Armatimonadota bacterium]